MPEKDPAGKHETWLNRTAHSRICMQAFTNSAAWSILAGVNCSLLPAGLVIVHVFAGNGYMNLHTPPGL